MFVDDSLTATAWVCIALQIYHYVGYPALVGLAAAIRGRSEAIKPVEWPKVSLVISAFNEAGLIARKVTESRALDYPALEVLVVADGSDDGTEEMARSAAGQDGSIHVLYRPERQGKAAAMNRGARAAQGDILLFSDANAFYERDAVKAMVAPFAASSVAVVSGSKTVSVVTEGTDGKVAAPEGLYWRYETFIRRAESRLGSTVAVVGEILAVRREDWVPIPAGVVNDDAWIAMTNLARGRDVRFADNAVSREAPSPTGRIERTRRRRINAGRLRLLGTPGVWPWKRPWVLAAFVSHKAMRLALPFLMFGGFFASIASVIMQPDSRMMVLALAAQTAFLLLALSAQLGLRWRIAKLALHIVSANLAVIEAIFDLLRGKSFTVWEKPAR